MNTKVSFLSPLAAALALVSVGCTQPQNTAQNAPQRKYYHDRSNSIGSNVPRSYSDPVSANNGPTQSSVSAMQTDQAMQGGSAYSSASVGGGGVGNGAGR